jgi:hypothetical protein
MVTLATLDENFSDFNTAFMYNSIRPVYDLRFSRR